MLVPMSKSAPQLQHDYERCGKYVCKNRRQIVRKSLKTEAHRKLRHAMAKSVVEELIDSSLEQLN